MLIKSFTKRSKSNKWSSRASGDISRNASAKFNKYSAFHPEGPLKKDENDIGHTSEDQLTISLIDLLCNLF